MMMKFAGYLYKKKSGLTSGLTICYVMLLFFLIWSSIATAQNAQPTATKTPTSAKTPVQEFNLKESLEKSLISEKESIKQLEEQLQNLLYFEKDIEAEINAYKIKISAYNSLLLVPNTPIEELDKVRVNSRNTLDHIAARLKELTQERNTFDQMRLKTEEQYAINQKQLNEIKTDSSKQGASDPQTTDLLGKLQNLTNQLDEKRKTLERMQITYTELIKKLEEIQRDFTILSDKFTTQIEEQKKRELFERKANPLTLLGWQQIQIELEQLVKQIQLVLSLKFWIDTVQVLWNAEGFILIRYVLFFAIALFLLLRLRRFFISLLARLPGDQYPWRYLMLQVLQRSLLLAGATGFLYLYAQIRLLYSMVTVAQVFVQILMILLLSRWILDVLTFWARKRGETNPARLIFHLRIFIMIVRYFMIAYASVEWALGSSSVILLLARVLFEISLFFGSIPFWEIFRATPQQLFPGKSETRQTLRSLTVGVGYMITSGGLLLELAGYGLLARYWYVSWWQTVIVLLWSLIILHVLREWDQRVTNISLQDQDKASKTAHQLHWLVVRLCWVAWPVLFIVSLLLAWGAKQFVLVGVFKVLTHPVPIGGLNLRLLGIIYALLILLCTHVATRLWRRVLQERILVNSGLDTGLQVSITTISVYLLWLFGILWTLNSLGVGATSLAVAFGALGIGLGFGLQGIFNNFISGLILLFERPIEVNDVIEVNGVWGFVEKINVRATIVRTYDNSALIIPNSDIVSNQLTNWTFQDVRLRRTIQVGVAYGSDVKLVEHTLYEIAEKHPRVLTDPAPMVLFSDFGENALIFKLRVWTLLDYGLTTETDIRFEIDKIFRERHITIAFPQLDVHFDSEKPTEPPEQSSLKS